MYYKKINKHTKGTQKCVTGPNIVIKGDKTLFKQDKELCNVKMEQIKKTRVKLFMNKCNHFEIHYSTFRVQSILGSKA